MARVLWKAIDGREFIIDTVKENLKTNEELLDFINKLREEHGYEKPTFMSVEGRNSEGMSIVKKMQTIDINNLHPDINNKIKEAITEGLSRPDPKTLN